MGISECTFARPFAPDMSPATPGSTADSKHCSILHGCEQAFRRFGVRAISMADLARELGVSKKTLYVYVKDKADLVRQVFTGMCRRQESAMEAIDSGHDNAMEALIASSNFIQEELRGMHPSVLFDLSKYYPEAHQALERHKQSTMQGVLLRNIQRGQAQGLYREDVDPNVIAALHLAMVQFMTDPETLRQLGQPLSALQLQLHAYHLYGIASPKGLEYLRDRLHTEPGPSIP